MRLIMMKIKTFFKNENNVKYLVIATFFLSVILRTILGIAFGQINVFYDELLHWNLSKAVHYSLGNNFRNDILNYKEILYSMVISFSHYFGNPETQYFVAVGINSVLMSSVVFPIYLMSLKFINNKHQAGFIAFISIMIPEMFYTSKIIQENLYYPMVIWFFFLFIVLILKNQYKIANVIILSNYVYLISLCKQMALNIFAGVILYYLLQFFFFDKENRKKCVRSIIWFITIFLGLKVVYEIIFNLLNNLSTVSSSETTISVILGNLLDPWLLCELIFPAISYILMSILFFGFFTVLLPLSITKKLNKKERNLLLIIGTIFISTIAVICLRIIPSENLEDVTIRFHFRYLFFLLIPLLILFFSIYPKIVSGAANKKAAIMSVIFGLLLNYISIIPAKGSRIDCVGANYIKYLFDDEAMINTLHMLILISISICLYLLYRKKIKLLYSIIIVSIIIFGIVSNCYTYSLSYTSKQQAVSKKEDALAINEYFGETIASDMNSLLIISDTNVSCAQFEVYLQYPNYYYSKTKDFGEYIESNSGESFENLNLYSFNHLFYNKDIGYPKYIITAKKTLEIQGYDKVELVLKNYFLYSKNNVSIFK